MKKWLTCFLLLITFTATYYPCCLADECNEQEVASTHHEDGEETDGNCSPFSACATCSGFTDLSTPVQIVRPFSEHRVHYIALIVFNITTYSASFWQPPRYC